MKKFLLLLILFAAATIAFATKKTIKVQNYQFTKSTVNARVGDTIIFKWVEGSHTTTSTSVPAGAATWDKVMDATHKKFRYILKKAGVYKYRCTPHAAFGMTGTINVSAALAVDMSDIAVDDSYGKALLNWNTKSSKDLSYFSIQRSTDGENFTEIARVNPSADNRYHFIDNSNPDNRYIYYQVKALDTKGNGELSDIKMYTSNVAVKKLITGISPNPISSPGHLMLKFNANSDGTMLARLYNASGVLVRQEQMSASKGLNNGHLHLGDLPPGTYYLMCRIGNVEEKYTIIYK